MIKMRVKALGSLLAVLALLVGSIPATALATSSAEEPSSTAAPLAGHCSANVVCVFSGVYYSQPFRDLFCSDVGPVGLEGNRYSAENRCGNKTSYLRENGALVACINPGGEREAPGAFNEVYFPQQYGAFC